MNNNKILLIIGYMIINSGNTELIESQKDFISDCIRGNKK